ncbi:pyridoxamine 5'-phosphate oxidase family protein [Streptomyces sp. CHA1]|uniref:pyridoxamine 5'-phosphate oxidase family protein n=1 Tax=Streptomyces TaxID=1883 RepID=UPI001BFC141C|nr:MULTISPECIES: pyridoxamine 5'-phosphate oxidase family protein [unclassified Streptomyces]WTD01401.1 pyridoxamine 5'-phosphate oxidase family protein [Streptomyces albidoflavus]MBT3160569.1 pyridoxamine 5'-phosphate oxidase family protein [Streptomyces sp. G11C]MCO6704252.1 pyridoxamine 5'-phosphate oxidase family protein [Streptomyces sp. CHB9.2]MCO6710525.1 pyridoxamine 5'-phosphate oxidase family protein [Streptomyces sp. CHA3]MCO6716321.1 pyridoxamine 5'-phosphate oxidase family protein
MMRWHEVTAQVPEFAERVRHRFRETKQCTLATIRKDGAPRISATELDFTEDELWLGCIAGSLKAQDLRRDPRLALHCGTIDIPDTDQGAWVGDAKLAGVAHEIMDPARPGRSHRFWIAVTEIAYLTVARTEDHLVLETWHPDRGFRRRRR